jgi:hypothetical protein
MPYRTRELSKRTWPDFVDFFDRVHGCACTLNSFGRHCTLEGKNAAERARIYGAPDRSRRYFPAQEALHRMRFDAMKELVWSDRAHGILVYAAAPQRSAAAHPVGWCQFGRVEELPVPTRYPVPEKMYARDPASQWRITCFTTRIDHRGRGVATTALRAALAAIGRSGGGQVEAVPIAFTHADSELPKLRKTYGWRSDEVRKHLADWPTRTIPGIGTVRATHVTAKTLSGVGTMSMFEPFGFRPVRLDPAAEEQWWIPGDRVLMTVQL